MSLSIRRALLEKKLVGGLFIQRRYGADKLPEYLFSACVRDLAEIVYAGIRIIKTDPTLKELTKALPTDSPQELEEREALISNLTNLKASMQAAEFLALKGYRVAASMIQHSDQPHNLDARLIGSIRKLGRNRQTVRQILSEDNVDRSLEILSKAAEFVVEWTYKSHGQHHPEIGGVKGLVGERRGVARAALAVISKSANKQEGINWQQRCAAIIPSSRTPGHE